MISLRIVGLDKLRLRLIVAALDYMIRVISSEWVQGGGFCRDGSKVTRHWSETGFFSPWMANVTIRFQ